MVPPVGRVLDAYRRTLSEVRGALSADDGQWIRVGMLLENSRLLPPDERGTHLSTATDAIRTALGPARWAEGHSMDPQRPAMDSTLEGRLRTYCEIVENAGALALSDAMLAAYVEADPSVTPLEEARVEAVRARLAWKAGDLDVATQRYRRVASAARRLKSDELRVRTWIGDALVARLSGNYPRSRELAAKAVRLAERRDMRRLASLANQTLMVAVAVGRDFGAAVQHGWRAYLLASGDPSMESEALGNVGQVFLDAGYPEPAAAAFRAVIARMPTDRILLPVFGGLAVAASRSGHGDVVAWAQQAIERRARAGATAYDVASGYLDLARAWKYLRVLDRAEGARRRALDLARQYHFHEIEHHAREIDATAPAAQPLPANAEKVADAVLQLVGV